MNKTIIKRALINKIKKEVTNVIFSKKNKDIIYDIVSEKYALTFQASANTVTHKRDFYMLSRWIIEISPIIKRNSVRNHQEFLIYEGTYNFSYKNALFRVNSYESKKQKLNIVKVDIFGNNKIKEKIKNEFKDFIKNTTNNAIELKRKKRTIDYMKYGVDKDFFGIKGRSIDTIYSDQLDYIISIINKWKKDELLYKEHGLSFKTGILLHGIPGTGKTSIAKTIATYFDIPMMSVNLTTIKIDNLAHLSNRIREEKSLLILLEEIDLQSSENREEKIQELLTILDGAESYSNIIFLATTNLINDVDPRIKREGRFDNIIEVTDICKDTAIKMCNNFKSDPDLILTKYESIYGCSTDKKYNPAKLQKIILNNSKKENNDIVYSNTNIKIDNGVIFDDTKYMEEVESMIL